MHFSQPHTHTCTHVNACAHTHTHTLVVPNVENISSLKIILKENLSSGAATMDIGMRRILLRLYARLYALELGSY